MFEVLFLFNVIYVFMKCRWIIVYTAQKGTAKCIILSKAEVITALVIVSIHIVSTIFLAAKDWFSS